MSAEHSTVKFETVFEKELAEIVKRRHTTGLDPTDSGTSSDNQNVAQDLAGLALSGGGVRSASFNLGLLQALYQRGILRFIDYLSTVSGGGYVGSSLSSAVLHPDVHLRWQSEATSPEADSKPEHEPSRGGVQAATKFVFAAQPNGRQHWRILRMIHGGDYLTRPLMFFNRYVIGLFLTNAVVLSALLTVGALAAWVFRCLDYPYVVDWLYALGFRGDVQRAFFPAFVSFVAWLLVWFISFWRHGEQAKGHVARWLFLLTCIALTMAVASLLGTGDISFTHLQTEPGVESPKESIELVADELKWLLIVFLVIAMLPYFRLQDLIRSGTHPRSPIEGWIFAVASRALLYGLPLLTFGYLAHENISRFNDTRVGTRHAVSVPRRYDAVPLQFKDWRQTWRDIELQAATPGASQYIWFRMSEDQDGSSVDDAINRRTPVPVSLPNQTQTVSETVPLPVSSGTRQRLDTNSDLAKFSDTAPYENIAGRWKPVDAKTLRRSCKLLDELAEVDARHASWSRWTSLIAHLFSRQPNRNASGVESRIGPSDIDVREQFNNRREYSQLRWMIGNKFTRKVLSDPRLFESFEVARDRLVESDSIGLDDRIQRLDHLCRKADLLAQAEARLKPYRHASRSDESASGESRIDGQTRIQNNSSLDRLPPNWSPSKLGTWISHRERELMRLDESAGNRSSPEYIQARTGLVTLMSAENEPYRHLEEEVKAVNWELLQTFYADQFYDQDTVFAMVVLRADQRTRLRWALVSGVVLLVFGLLVNVNATSLHGFYRGRLARMWVNAVPGMGNRIPLARLETCVKGAPYHIFNATLSLLGRRGDDSDHGLRSFVFSQRFCGSTLTGYVATERFCEGRYDLANAMAVSGAAVTPVHANNALLAALLILTNSRLGQWLPNPLHSGRRPRLGARWLSLLPPSPLRLSVGMLRRAELREYCFLTDGGHSDNLGLLQLLKRRCRLIIVVDATCDPQYGFSEYVKVHRIARAHLGVRLLGWNDDSEVDLQSITQDETTGLADAHFTAVRVEYPKEKSDAVDSIRTGVLLYVKPTFTGDEPVDLLKNRSQHKAFPHDPTTDQFYDANKFESYRQLGFHIGQRLCSELWRGIRIDGEPGNPLARWSPNRDGD